MKNLPIWHLSQLCQVAGLSTSTEKMENKAVFRFHPPLHDTTDETRAQAGVAEGSPSHEVSTLQVPTFEVGKYVVAVHHHDEDDEVVTICFM